MTPGPGSKNETIKSNFTLRTCTCSKLGGLFVQFDGEPEKGGLTRRNCITASDTQSKRENCWVLQVNTLCLGIGGVITCFCSGIFVFYLPHLLYSGGPVFRRSGYFVVKTAVPQQFSGKKLPQD